MPAIDSEGNSPQGAQYKVPSSPKSVQKQGANPDDSASIQSKEVFPTGAYLAPPIITRPDSVTADYYRNGPPSEQDASRRLPARQLFPFGIQKDEDGDSVAASIRIRGKDKKNGNQEVDYIPAYTKFILENVQESYAERNQIIETFGDFYVFLFGARPSIFQFSGTLINSVNHNWVQDFMFFYENFIRGTKAVELQARAIMTYGGRQVEGFILGSSNQTNAATEEGVPFSFQMVITQRNFLGFSDDFGIVRGPGGVLISDQNLRSILKQQAGPTGKGTSDLATSDDHNAVSSAMAGGSPTTFALA